MKISTRLLLLFMLLAVLPLALFSYFNLQQDEASLRAEALGRMSRLADKKVIQIRSYLGERVQDVGFLARGPLAMGAINVLPDIYLSGRLHGPAYAREDALTRNYFSRYVEESGLFYDVFLITTQGEIVYTQKHEADFATNLMTGPWSESQLAQAFRNSRMTLEPVISDYEFYAPSSAPALFIAAPIMVDGKFRGVFAVQLGNAAFYRVARDATGLGQSGEAVFAQRDGDGVLHTTPLKYKDDAALKFRVQHHVNGENAMFRAVSGESGVGMRQDYRGKQTVAAWRYLPELGWGMVVKMDADEVLAPIGRQRMLTLEALLGLLLLAGLAAYFFGRQISEPLKSLAQTVGEMAMGNLNRRANESAPGELGLFAQAFNRMAENLQGLYRVQEERIEERTRELHAANEQLQMEINVRKQSMMKLQENEESLRLVLEQALDAVIIMDEEGRVAEWNGEAARIFGFRRDEVIGKELADLIIPPPLREAHRQGMQRLLATNESRIIGKRIEVKAIRRNGGEFPVELSITKIYRGERVLFSAFLRDITERKHAETVLKKHKKVLDLASDGFWMVDMQGNLIEVNQAYADISGYTVDELVRMCISQLEAKEQPEATKAHIEKVMAQGYDRFETRHRHKHGHEIDIEVTASFLSEAQQFAVFLRDITAQKLVENRLRVEAVAFETHEGIMVTDANANIIRVNQAFQQITGYAPEEVAGRNPRLLSSGRHDREFYAGLWGTLLEQGTWSGEIWDKRKNGEIYPKWLTISAVKDVRGNTTEYVAIFSDITARKRAEEDIRNLAFYDALTGLPNRRLLMDRAQLALSLSERSHHCGALLFLDMDRFKTLNDTLGHDFGDLMLVEVARRVQACVREADTVARLGGDEFVVLIEEIGANLQEASQKVALIAEKIRATLTLPYMLNEHEYHSSTSIGVCMYRGHSEPVDVLMKHADMAMYQAKDSGRNAVRFFDPLMQQAVEAHAELEADLRGALPNRQLQLYYQLQVDGDHRAIGAEALIRWKHPRRGMVPPGQFIPIAEESSLILDIGHWVIETACRQLAAWRQDERRRHLILAINVSAQQFQMVDFVPHLEEVITKYGVTPQKLKLELTESVVLGNVADVVSKMHALKALGVRLSLDDFGTGYSSLAYLKQLPLDQIKIDQSFVRDVITDPNDAVMVQTIIDMAQNFRLNVIAEGVETEAQLIFLKQNGCMAYQGYLFSRPLPIEEFEVLLAGM
ncbi:MAG: PAS domain S-box protein [Nitrosomonadales bacterium]|nr:PAS domain S-box protein [Nitrosomonadales bacterium]